jgi:hypothetical protein
MFPQTPFFCIEVENWFSSSVSVPSGTQYFLHISSLTGRLSAGVFLSTNILSLPVTCDGLSLTQQ